MLGSSGSGFARTYEGNHTIIAADPRSAARITAGHAFVQNLRRGHYELTNTAPPLRLATAFTELALAM